MKKVLETWPDDVRIVFKHQPLSFHDRAKPAALASMAANAQGKFWEFHDKLFTDKKFTDEDLERYATEVGLDVAQYNADLKAGKFDGIVEKHAEQATAIGASGTPAFFVNGRSLSGAKPFPEFKALIEEELKKAKEMVTDGVAKADVYAEILKGAAGAKGGEAAKLVDDVRHTFNVTNSPSMGPRNARATVVIFSDFQ